MKKFTDKNKNDWILNLTVGTAKRVKADCGVDLINIIDVQTGAAKSVLEELAANPILLVDVLFSLCRKQAEERGIDDFAFADIFDGETIQNASEALVEEIINFSPPVTQKILMKIYAKNKEVMGENEKELEAILESPEFDKDLEAFMKSSIGTPESSE